DTLIDALGRRQPAQKPTKVRASKVIEPEREAPCPSSPGRTETTAVEREMQGLPPVAMPSVGAEAATFTASDVRYDLQKAVQKEELSIAVGEEIVRLPQEVQDKALAPGTTKKARVRNRREALNREAFKKTLSILSTLSEQSTKAVIPSL